MSVAFDRIWSILQNNSNVRLPKEIEEVCKLTPDQYKALKVAFPSPDQALIDEQYQLAAKCIRILPLADSAEKNGLIQSAIASLQIIRDYQNQRSLVGGLESSMDKVYLELAYYALPKDLRRSIVAKVVALNTYLESASQRNAALILFHNFGCQSASELVVSIAKTCRGWEDIDRLSFFLRTIPHGNGFFLPMVAPLLTRFSPENWVHFQRALSEQPLLILPQISSLLMFTRTITSDQFLAVIDVVKGFNQDPRLLMLAGPLLNLCDEGSHAALILQEVIRLDSRHRKVVIDRTRGEFISTTDSSIVHMILLQKKEIVLQEELARDRQRADLSIEFALNPDDLGECPHMLLSNFIKFLETGDHGPESIVFIGSKIRGIGIAKEFVKRLVEELGRRMGFACLSDGRMRLQAAKLTPEEEEVYLNLGKLFMYCMRHDLVIGMQLDPGLFACLAALSETHLCEINRETFDLFFPLYCLMRDYYEDDKHALSLIKASLHEDETVEVLLEAMPKAIAPCIAVWKGMTVNMTALELEKCIQGTVTAKDILERLEFGVGVTADNEPIIREWIAKLDKDSNKLRKFLTVVTGAPGLGPLPIKIEISGISIQAHTCVQQLSLSSDTSIEEALIELDMALNRENYFDSIE